MRYLALLLILSSQAIADIRTCEDLAKATRSNLSDNPTHWYGNAIFRGQAEKLARFYLATQTKRDWDNPITFLDIPKMLDRELDDFGEGIYFGELTDITGQSYIYAQFGFGGGNWFSMIFHRGSTQLATRVYEWDGECQIFSY